MSVPAAGSFNAPLARTEEPINVDASSFLSEYQASEEAANTRYEDRKVAITGVLSGVFIPPPGTPLPADAFVTMGGRQILTPSDALELPGVTAYSVEDGSFFGTDSSNPLQVGRSVTLVCTCGKGHPAIARSGYAVMLTGCLLQNASSSEDRPRESENQASRTSIAGEIGSDRLASSLRNQGFVTYTNGRFGFHIDYPQSFVSKDPPENGDGVELISSDGGASLVVSGSNNSGMDISNALRNAIESAKERVEYQGIGTNWFVISWREGNLLKYQKTFLGGGSENSFEFTYPAAKKSDYEQVVTTIEKSFTPGDLEHAQ